MLAGVDDERAAMGERAVATPQRLGVGLAVVGFQIDAAGESIRAVSRPTWLTDVVIVTCVSSSCVVLIAIILLGATLCRERYAETGDMAGATDRDDGGTGVAQATPDDRVEVAETGVRVAGDELA